MFSHIRSQEQARIRLIHGITFRSGEVHKVLAVFQHLRAAGLLAGLVGQMCGRYCCAGSDSIDSNICIDQPHGNVFSQRIDRALGRCIRRAAEGTVTVCGRDIDDAAFVFRKEELQCFPVEPPTAYRGEGFLLLRYSLPAKTCL